MKIIKIETIPLHIPVKFPLIESGGTFNEFNHVIIKVHCDNGVIGISEVEAYPSFERPGVETQAGIVAIIKDHLENCLVGENPYNIERIWLKMDHAIEGYLRVKGPLDIALYDAIGKHLGIPVYELIGGCVRDEYFVEGVGYGISIEEPKNVAAIARKAVSEGYRELELKAGDDKPEMDVERLKKVRSAIGPNIPIKIDFNGYYDAKTAILIIKEMEQFGIQWVEQPVKYWDLEGLAFVRNAVNTKLVVDEAVESCYDLINIIKAKAADAVHIKPTIKGGLTGAKKLSALAEAAGLDIIPGTSAPTGLGIAGVQAFIASLGKMARGTHGSPLDIIEEDIILNPIPRNSTKIKIPRNAGLGVELNEKILKRYRAD